MRPPTHGRRIELPAYLVSAYHGCPWHIHRLAYGRTDHKNLRARNRKK